MTGKYDTPTRLAELRSAKNMSQNDLAKRLGTTGQSVGRYEKEPQRLSVPLLRQIAKELGATVAEIVGETTPDSDLALVPELDLRAISGLGGSSLEVTKENVETVTRARYGFPEEHFRQIFGVGTGMADIAEVVGDSMYPTLIPGEKVVLNRADRIPSPPGIFVVWDGLGLVMKRVSFAPHSNPPMVRIASDNPAYEPYERSLDEAHILARVVGKFSRTG